MTVQVSLDELDNLMETLNPGSFLVVATEGEVRIKGMYVDYVWSR